MAEGAINKGVGLQNHYDIIIVGAGMVGATMACLLAKQSRAYKSGPLQIALLEARPAPAFNPEQFDPRVAAITEKSRQLLDHCGVWEAVVNKRVSPYVAMDVWDAEGTGRIQFDCHDIHQPSLGHIVENAALVDSLMAEIAELDNIGFYCPAVVADYHRSEQGISVQLEDGTPLSAQLLLAADGANSAIRKHFDFATVEWDYGHSAIVTTITTQLPNQQTAWQRFMPTGPLALLPLISEGDLHHSSIVWSQDTAEAERLMGLSDEYFCAELSRASEHCLGQVLRIDKRFTIPLRQRHAKDYILPRLALLGDAAHSIHPLAGQGVNLGFSDVQVLAEEIDRAVKRGVDIGDPSVLKRYQRRRKPENLATMAAMEGFKRLFSAEPLGVRLLRNMGMSKLNQVDLFKNQIMKLAMGL
jgi:2-octaprenylphenol hydroxylase